MSKFKIEVEVQGYEVKLGLVKFSVEGTKEDAPEIAERIERQLRGMVQAPAVMAPTALTPGNGKASPKTIDAVEIDSGGTAKRKAKRSGGGGSKTPADDINIVHDSAKYGTPQMTWTTAEKAIWFLYIVNEQANVSELTAYNIAKNFNKYFKASKPINGGNVMTGLDKERGKGTSSTVSTTVTEGTTKYFLTQAGITMAQRLAKGESATAVGAA